MCKLTESHDMVVSKKGIRHFVKHKGWENPKPWQIRKGFLVTDLFFEYRAGKKGNG